MKLHRGGRGYFLQFIKDFGDDVGALFIGLGLGSDKLGMAFFGAISLIVSLFLKFRVFNNNDELNN